MRARGCRRAAIGLASAVALGAGAGQAAAAPPDLFPFVPSEGGLQTSRWYVDTAVDGGVYSARYHFATQVVNGGGRFRITAGAPAGGTPAAPLAAAVQDVDGAAVPLPPSVRLVGRTFGVGDVLWGIEGLARYSLTPATGPAIESALGATCREDNAVFAEPGAPASAPAEFAPRGAAIGGQVVGRAACAGLDASAAGFSSGISTGWQDVIALSSANSAYFDIAGAAPGPGLFRARVSPGGEIAQGGAAGNDVELRPLDVPGVVANPAAGVLPGPSGQVVVRLSASVREPQVRGRRVGAGSPADGSDAAPASGAVRYALGAPPAAGAVSIDPATGRAVYTPNPGPAAADGFTFVAEDSRGLRSAPAQVFIDPPGSPARVGLGRPDLARTLLRRTRPFRARQQRVFRVRVPRAQRTATFSVSWARGRYAVRLRPPRGRILTRSAGRAVRLTRGRTFRAFRVQRPKPGVWRVIVRRAPPARPRIDRAAIRVAVLGKG